MCNISGIPRYRSPVISIAVCFRSYQYTRGKSSNFQNCTCTLIKNPMMDDDVFRDFQAALVFLAAFYFHIEQINFTGMFLR